ncbi:MAG: helix-turn-helix domain-containing protein [Ktedonobacteraceae bacterium]|nr:helix-turn-helix domain-containing protein [Ktedonobacteraceae bacterium]
MLSQVLKDYRNTYAVTQEQLANDLSIDVRTLRRWENQETVLKDTEELRRIASVLGMEAERLGLTTESLTDEQVIQTQERVWQWVNEGRAWEARAIAEQLVSDLQEKAKDTGNTSAIYQLTNAHHAAAYARGMNSRVSEFRCPLESYEAMEETAKSIDNPLLRAIAVTYQGDMYTRANKLEKSIPLLQQGVELSPIDNPAARGNAIQLLARALLKAGDVKAFEENMKEAEALAGILSNKEITRGQYGLLSVYEEYAKSYALQGRGQKALDYIEKAYATGMHEKDKHWQMVLKTTKVIALVRGGEVSAGTELAVECIEECKKYGTIRLLERIYGVHAYLKKEEKRIGKSAEALGEALHGSIEY